MEEGPRPARILIPTQLPVGPVNVYLLKGDETVLVDTGPHHDLALDRLEKGLKRRGVGMEDLDVILITHGHVDHYGQAGRIAAASGAEVWVHTLDRDTVADFSRTYDERREFYRERFLPTGVPAETLKLLGGFFDYLKNLARGAPVHKTFEDGDVLNLAGWDFEVVHTPGHSAGSVCLQHDRTLLAGDTVLKHITPNAAFGGADGESVGMADYLLSLDRLEQCDVRELYTGHGPRVDDLAGFIENYRNLYLSRRDIFLDFLSGKGHTAMEMVDHLFGELPIEEVFLGITEILGHLEILQRDGLVEVEEKDSLLYYTASPS